MACAIQMCGCALEFRHKYVTSVRIYSLEGDFGDCKVCSLHTELAL